MENVRQRAMQYGIASNFRLAGFVSDADLPSYYNMADVFVLPSKSGEGLPLVAMEAMACGLPVVATDVGGIKEVLPRKFGKLVPPNQPELLADAVLEFASLDFAARRADLHAAVKTQFSWDVNVNRLRELYEELI